MNYLLGSDIIQNFIVSVFVYYNTILHLFFDTDQNLSISP